MANIKSSRWRKLRKNNRIFTLMLGLVFGFLLGKSYRFLFPQKAKACEKDSSYTYSENRLTNLTFEQKTDKLLLIGILTADKFLTTRARSLYNTWGKEVSNHIHFFTSENSTLVENLPIVRLKGIDDIYPPQKKSFHMLKYMHDNYIDEYEFFMRSDDDLHLRPKLIQEFLNYFNSSDVLYLGSFGRGLQKEIKQLKLNGYTFCMGGPSILLSRAALKKLAPHLDDCLKNNIVTTHEDVELGRCIRDHLKIPCPVSYQLRSNFFHTNAMIGSDGAFYPESLAKMEIHNALTLHPIKKPDDHFRIHHYVQRLSIKEEELAIIELLKEINYLISKYKLENTPLNDEINGIFLDHMSVHSDHSNSIEWNFLSKNASYSLEDGYPMQKISNYTLGGIKTAVEQIKEYVYNHIMHRIGNYNISDLQSVYTRLHPALGPEYIFDGFVSGNTKNPKLKKRSIHQILIPYGPLYVSEIENKFFDVDNFFYTDETATEEKFYLEPITVILPFYETSFTIFSKFMDNYKTICSKNNENVRLIIILFENTALEKFNFPKVHEAIINLRTTYSNCFIEILEANTIFKLRNVLRVIKSVSQDDDLLLFVNVKDSFNFKSLERVRMHTIQGQQVYFPLALNVFKCEETHQNYFDKYFTVNVKEENIPEGGFHISSIYYSDIMELLARQRISYISEWNFDIYNKIIEDKKLTIMRAVDPDIISTHLCPKTTNNRFLPFAFL